MIEILPNWHPVFVHFTIALLSMSVLFYLIQMLLPEHHRWQTSISTLSKVNLWLGTGFAIITAIAGWFAYNSVAHDTLSHAAMTDHRNWALVTLGVFIVLTLWSLLFRKQKKAPIAFVIAMLIAGALLASTGWRGAESVYRYGLGVMSLPKSTGEGHDHQHADGEGHIDTAAMPTSNQSDVMQQTNQKQEKHANDKLKVDTGVTLMPESSSNKPVLLKQTPKNTHDNTPHTH